MSASAADISTPGVCSRRLASIRCTACCACPSFITTRPKRSSASSLPSTPNFSPVAFDVPFRRCSAADHLYPAVGLCLRLPEGCHGPYGPADLHRHPLQHWHAPRRAAGLVRISPPGESRRPLHATSVAADGSGASVLLRRCLGAAGGAADHVR